MDKKCGQIFIVRSPLFNKQLKFLLDTQGRTVAHAITAKIIIAVQKAMCGGLKPTDARYADKNYWLVPVAKDYSVGFEILKIRTSTVKLICLCDDRGNFLPRGE